MMQAVEVVQASDTAPGTVVDVFRPGYISNGRVLRVAEVKVVGGTPVTTGEQDYG
jgi:molecular chaperone GrpE (heat shock protein)